VRSADPGTDVRPLLVATEYSRGDPAEGNSWAYLNLLLPLRAVFPAATLFDYIARMSAVGRDAMNAELRQLVASERPDVTIIVLRTDQLVPEIVRSLSQWTTTVAYLLDDSWRRGFSDLWARHVDIVTTPEVAGIERFRRSGIRNAVVSPFPFNEDLYVRMNAPKMYDVSFIGQYHPHRAWLIEGIERSGVRVAVFGPGWPAGVVTHEDLVRIISASRINLNLSNSICLDPAYVFSSALAFKWTLREVTRRESKWREQVKGRHFEIAGCGGFQLSYAYPGIAEHFVIGREIETFNDRKEMIRKVHYYLEHEDERRTIADNAWRRAHADHTGRKRVRELVDAAFARQASGS
jgi:spore maturation protein CgeB